VIRKTTGHRDRGVAIWADMIVAVWWISVLWLSLASAAIVYFLIQWVVLKDDPLRYETAIVSAFVFFGSIPAGLGVLVAGVVPGTGLSILKRVFGIALLLFCFAGLMLHDYLQARYR
jgi:hypothetical protein